MRPVRVVLAAAIAAAPLPAFAVEGPTVAGPIGGNDIRSAVLPPPGVYIGASGSVGTVLNYVDRNGDPNPLLRHAERDRQVFGPFLYYVPDFKLLGGSVGAGILMPTGNQCGRIFAGEREQCRQGFGDPYVELDWSRSFGALRPSKYAGAYPIRQGLTVLAGFGVVFPAGTYDDTTRTRQVLSMGTNIWDFAPALGVTYTTAPILAEGTEFSAKLYWNNYLENPSTQFWTGDVLSVDFAVSERIGRWQIGLAGVFGVQTETDERAGTPLKDTEALAIILGPVVNYDMPETRSSVKAKMLRTVYAENFVEALTFVLTWHRKF
jgi:hypothetical protein